MTKKSTTEPEFDKENFIISPEKAEDLRMKYLLGPMREYVCRFLNDYPLVKTVEVRIGQYYDDEANDAVHFRMYPTVHQQFVEPPIDPPWQDRKGRTHTPQQIDFHHDDSRGTLRNNLPFIQRRPKGEEKNSNNYFAYPDHLGDVIRNWEESRFGWSHWLRKAGWESNSAMISLFSAFIPENNDRYQYNPLCSYRREREGKLKYYDVTMEMTGTKHRPEMDGLLPEDVDLTYIGASGDDEEKQLLTWEEKSNAYFKWVYELIEQTRTFVEDPLSEIKNHFKRHDLTPSGDDRRYHSPRMLYWALRGPVLTEGCIKETVQNDDALREIEQEWERRNAFDQAFHDKYSGVTKKAEP